MKGYSMTNYKCPCCGIGIANQDTPEFLLYVDGFSDIEADIIEHLVTKFPKVTTRNEIADFVYAFRDEPDSDCLKVHLHRVRRRVKQYGWSINNLSGATSGRLSKYKLEKNQGGCPTIDSRKELK